MTLSKTKWLKLHSESIKENTVMCIKKIDKDLEEKGATQGNVMFNDPLLPGALNQIAENLQSHYDAFGWSSSIHQKSLCLFYKIH